MNAKPQIYTAIVESNGMEYELTVECKLLSGRLATCMLAWRFSEIGKAWRYVTEEELAFEIAEEAWMRLDSHSKRFHESKMRDLCIAANAAVRCHV